MGLGNESPLVHQVCAFQSLNGVKRQARSIFLLKQNGESKPQKETEQVYLLNPSYFGIRRQGSATVMLGSLIPSIRYLFEGLESGKPTAGSEQYGRLQKVEHGCRMTHAGFRLSLVCGGSSECPHPLSLWPKASKPRELPKARAPWHEISEAPGHALWHEARLPS